MPYKYFVSKKLYVVLSLYKDVLELHQTYWEEKELLTIDFSLFEEIGWKILELVDTCFVSNGN